MKYQLSSICKWQRICCCLSDEIARTIPWCPLLVLQKVVLPYSLVVDGHYAQTSNEVKRLCDQFGTTLKILEAGTPWANRAELYIGWLKEAVRKDLRASNAPMVLWDYAIQRRASIHNDVPRTLLQADGQMPHVSNFGFQGDISNLCTFGWHKWVYYRDGGSFPKNKDFLKSALSHQEWREWYGTSYYECKSKGNFLS